MTSRVNHWLVTSGVIVLLLISSAPADAQSGIAGTVTDATGGVLPGVSVEASSPVLIEQVRTVVTDGSGEYRLVDLRPGTYKVTFSLPGFNTIVREGVSLESAFTATINAQMRVGGVAETITVSGASPVVDVQSTMSRTVLSKEQVDSLPTGRSYQSLAATIPAVTPAGGGRFDVGGTQMSWQGNMTAYGSLSSDTSLQVDGMSVMSLLGQGQTSGVYHNQGAYQEMTYQVVGGSAESQTGGVLVNMVPKEGGNRFAGDGIAMYSNQHLQSNNLDDGLRSKGLKVANGLVKIWDDNISIGGPLWKEHLWFFNSERQWGVSNYITNQYFADGSPAIDRTHLQAYTTRLTWQAGRRDKFTAMYDAAPKYRQYFGSESGTLAPTGAAVQDQWNYNFQGKWTSTITNKLLAQVGYSQNFVGFIMEPQPETPAGTIAKSDVGIQSKGLFDAPATLFYNPFVARQVVATLSYVSGSHNIKIGLQDKFGWLKNTVRNSGGNMVQVYNSGAPLQIRAYNTPVQLEAHLNRDLGLYVQDSWRLKRLTLNPGLRFEWFNGSLPAQSAPAGRFVGAREFAAIDDLPNFKNWVPRLGGAYDVFADGKTAVKGSVGKYMQQDATSFAQTYNPMQTAQANLGWVDLNSNNLAEGNLGCTFQTPGCEINFAQLPTTFGARRNRNPAPSLKRPYQLVYNAGVSRELRSNLGVAFNYYRREFHDITYTTNLANPVSGYMPVSLPDPRGGGQTITVYNANPATNALVNELDTTSANNKTTYNGVDVTVTARLRNGVNVSGGSSTGRSITAVCDVADPNYVSAAAAGLSYCDQSQYSIPWLTTLKFSGTVPVAAGFRLSAVLQSLPGDAITQTFVVTAANFRTLTGTPLTQSSVIARLTKPGALFAERVNQLDLTLSKSFKFGSRGARMFPEVSLFNVFNANPVLTQTTAYPNLGVPLSILTGRLLRLQARVQF
jgi:hypothetical protein